MNFEWLTHASPIYGTGLHTLAYVLLLSWVLCQPRDAVLAGAEERSRWRDLRLWIIPLVLIQILLYWIF